MSDSPRAFHFHSPHDVGRGNDIDPSLVIARLRAEIAEKDKIIREQADALAHSRKIFERSSVAARIGVWECRLSDQALTWTNMVYDIFDLPRGSTIDRNTSVGFYSQQSAEELQSLRSKAIDERTGFTMDAEIITARGNRRWMRLTATVECEGGQPVRIFGMKQDITEEKLLLDRTRYLAEFDIMTGLANRIQFQSKLAALCESQDGHSLMGGLLLADLDGFKAINDTYGHAAGDECLKVVAERLRAICKGVMVVARIGGDEFGILLARDSDRGSATDMARRIVECLGTPLEYEGKTLKLGISVGVAFADTLTPSELFHRADLALYAAKAAGRNTFRVFSESQEARAINTICAA